MVAVKCFRGVVVGLSLALVAQTAQAQSAQAERGLVHLISDTFEASALGLLSSTGVAGLGVRDGAGRDTGAAIDSALVVELGSFPIGSSSGGFTYFFEPASGAYVRTSQSFGPAFAERPLTGGRGKLSFGMTHQHRVHDRLEGKSLQDGEVAVSDQLVTFAGNGWVPLDIVQSSFAVTIETDTTTLFGTYGATDRLDVAVAVPLQRVSVDARVTTGLLKYSAIPAVTVRGLQQASGIGDIAVRAKYNLLNRTAASVAAGMDVRLPTGDEQNLLGTGNTRVKVYGAAASQISRVLPHVNFGYTFRSEPENTTFFFGPELSYAAGAEFVLTPRATLVGDVIGRSLAEEGRLHDESKTVDLAVISPITGRLTAEPRTYNGLRLQTGERLNLMLGTFGVKFSPLSTFMISTHVLFPLRSEGLQSGFTPVIGVDYTF
jgi:Putative MetA-pathway of phenol degradation